MAEPSKVIHIRNVGHEIAEVRSGWKRGNLDSFPVCCILGWILNLICLVLGERLNLYRLFTHMLLILQSDLLQLLQPFGVVSKIVMLRAKNQALLQMEDMHASVSALQYYSTVQPSVRGRNVYMQFSSHQELTTDQSSHGRNSDQVCHAKQLIFDNVTCNNTKGKAIFTPCLFYSGFQALIQYQSRQEAVEAFGSLHGRNIYDGCCQLDIQYSNLSELQVHYNNDRSRDFTNPSLPTEQRPRNSQQQAYPDPTGLFAFQQPGGGALNFNYISLIFARKHLMLPSFSFCSFICPDHALVEMADGLQAELAVTYLKGAILFGKKLEVNYSKYPNITSAPDAHDYLNSSLNRFNSNVVKNYRHCCAPTKMIHISALPQEISEDAILNHVSEHGSVVNTKLFEVNGKRQALVLFETEEEATEALVSKHASSLEGNTIRISFSQMQSI
ncbi:hypothetical protein PR202_gb01355 [Eleusine coracana subsp. coracana]|uniref:RRM domain-containing protein n=1 Tax=Eleusine coracana subsp. coracana TaxID=191504 RepID=A0AAV5DWC5_ELECO|nr:hypothetical protein PR202_gb01355 [Eleusine coracana subsp. coracana]